MRPTTFRSVVNGASSYIFSFRWLLNVQGRELATRLSILRAEMKQMQSSSEYLTDYFAEPLPGEPPNALLLEVNTDIQSLARDIHTSETRFEYVTLFCKDL